MTTEMPIGTVLPWFKSISGTPNLPKDWVECNGNTQTIPSNSPYAAGGTSFTPPNLTNRFLRGANASGTTGGTSSHSHSVSSRNQLPSTYSYNTRCRSGTSSTSTHLPPNMRVVWILKVL